MKRSIGVFAALMLVVPAASAYQVTGPVLDVTDNKIVVEKGKEKWEIERDKDTKVTGALKKGSKVTVQYRMTATSIESRDTKGSKDTTAAKETKTPAAKDTKASATKDKAMAK
jgi:RNase P/RNase MRP subunit p29